MQRSSSVRVSLAPPSPRQLRTARRDNMLTIQQAAQQAEQVKLIAAIITMLMFIYWRLLLRIMVAFVAVATVVGAATLMEFMHR